MIQLYGRREEHARISALLAGARESRAGVLVIRGEPGVGKSSLLRDATEQARDFRQLQGTGVESEAGLAFAGLHQLLRPVLNGLDRLPAPQADALRGAFGLADARSSRFLVELGVLSLLTELARREPVLCLVDDAQWLDRASADGLLFVARRLDAERIVLLMVASDDGPRQFQAPGVPEFGLGGLDVEAAGQLLQSRFGKVAPAVRDRLVEETGGNPLALLELPATLTSGQLAGTESLPQRLPLTGRVQQAFLQRVQRLPEATRTLLLVAATVDDGELATILAAGRRLGAEAGALEPAEQAGLVQVAGQELQFRHPLVRSAIYQGATFAARQGAHRALVHVLEGEAQADRRAWHLAGAAIGPDEEVAGALEVAADRARRRGGPAAAAAWLERAATLTPGEGARTRRLAAAAEHLWDAGHGQRALALLDTVEPASADLSVRARMAHVQGAVELATGTPATACALLVEGATPILASDPERATAMLVVAARAALAANRADRLVEEIGPAIAGVSGQRDNRVERVAQSLVAAGLAHSPPGAATLDLASQSPTAWPHPAFAWMWPVLVMAEPDGGDADQRYARSVAARRAARTVSTLTVALANLAFAEMSLGRWPSAVGNATEGLRLARETGQRATSADFLVVLAAVAAHQGRADDCRGLVDEALSIATALRLAVVAALATWTLASLDLAEGRPGAALDRLLALAAPQHPGAHAPVTLLATPTLVEAAAHADGLAGMEPFVARLERWAASDRRTWTSAVACRCRALISDGDRADRNFQAALTVDGLGELPVELARTELLYGEWLRRARRRAEARVHLRAAMELYERLGATPWVERARTELRASGETARKRDPSTRVQLTPQELQIARLAGEGLTNHQIAAQLFLSRHTVGYHLHKVYAKLGITSRADLRQVDLEDRGGSR